MNFFDEVVVTFQQGAIAYWDYKTQLDNPYRLLHQFAQTDSSHWWQEGFYEARSIDNGDI